MDAHDWGGFALPCGDQGTGTQDSFVGRRSRLVNVDLALRAADHPQVPDSGLVPCKTLTGKMAPEQQTVWPLKLCEARRTTPPS